MKSRGVSTQCSGAPPGDLFDWFLEATANLLTVSLDMSKAVQIYWNGILKYSSEFLTPAWTAQNSFWSLERRKLSQMTPWESARCYGELLKFNLLLADKGIIGSLETMGDYHLSKLSEAVSAWVNTAYDLDKGNLVQYTAKQLRLLDLVVNVYPKAIRDIEAEYGFHFEDGGYAKAAETDRFELYQVLPRDELVQVRDGGKPIVIVPPYVLGPNILAFLPGENRSYVQCFADQGIPTYVRIVKDIETSPAVQTMTPEEDVLDTRFFCEHVKARHGKPVTLNGFCQGGLLTVMAVLSGELDGLVDAHITCAAPMDGTRSKGLVGYMDELPDCFRSLGYASKTLPNGNQVVDGKVMSLVYKLKSIDEEAPLLAFYRDLKMFDKPGQPEIKISKTAAAINYWMLYDQRDLPQAITELSYKSYTIPVTEEGVLPVKLFGKKLSFKRIREKGIKWLICYAENDNLVEKEAALAPLDYISAEVCAFPKGHASIATSWSVPTSEYALHTRFSGRDGTRSFRGPVRFQLDLEQEMETSMAGSDRDEPVDAATDEPISQRKESRG
jgi:hypothetical protein